MAARGSLCYSRSPSHEMTVTLAMRVIGLILLLAAQETHARAYYGRRIGSLSELEHAVKGEVYAVDSRTLFVKGFSYDGTAPDAYFYVGKSGNKPHDKGIIVPNEKGSKDPLRGYNNKDLTLTLPDGLTLQDIAWISVWCKAYTIDFGHLMIPRNFVHPRPQKIDALPTFEHDVSSDRIVVVDAQTFLIPNFHYDGQAPDAFFWVGKGTKPGPEGTKVPDENGSLEPLKKYTGKTIVITLPGDLTVFDIDYLSVWCRAFYADFGHVRISKDLNVPPSLKMLGVAPQDPSGYAYHRSQSSSTFHERKPKPFNQATPPFQYTLTTTQSKQIFSNNDHTRRFDQPTILTPFSTNPFFAGANQQYTTSQLASNNLPFTASHGSRQLSNPFITASAQKDAFSSGSSQASSLLRNPIIRPLTNPFIQRSVQSIPASLAFGSQAYFPVTAAPRVQNPLTQRNDILARRDGFGSNFPVSNLPRSGLTVNNRFLQNGASFSPRPSDHFKIAAIDFSGRSNQHHRKRQIDNQALWNNKSPVANTDTASSRNVRTYEFGNEQIDYDSQRF